MAIPHAKPGEVVDVRPLGSALASSQTATLLRAEQVEVRRLVVPAGKAIAEHQAKGEIVVQCLEGKVAFTAFGKTQNLEAGKLLYLPTGEPHSVQGIENASLLLTILLPQHGIEEAVMPLSPLEAASRINEQVTVEMLVKAAKNCPHCSQIFLDSEEDHHNPNNLAVAVTETGKPRFKDIGSHDPAGHFKGKLIRVTGVVTLMDNPPQIEVDDPRQIEIVETKG
jgi:quercetin dioxygenase-like cupin family protein